MRSCHRRPNQRAVWLDPRPGVFHRRPKPPNCPTRRWSPARHFGRFVPGKGGSAQGRSRTEHRNQTRVPGVFISYHGACRRLAILQKTQTHHRRHDDDNDPRQKKTPRARSRAPFRAWNVWPVDMAGLWCSSRARARSCGVSRREAHGRLKDKPPQRRGGMWLGMWDAPRGTGAVFSCFMIVLNIPRRLRWPNRAGSTRNVDNNS